MRQVLAAFAIALLFAAPAAAADAMRIGAVDATRQPRMALSVVTATESSRPPTLRENGQPVIGFEAENLGRAKSVVLAIDVSRSMEGQAIADAATAARAFLAAKPEADRLALVGFGRSATQLTGFSTSTIDPDATLRSLTVDAQQGTALYDAIRLSAQALAGEPLDARVLIVLTDGVNITQRGATLEAAVAAARDANVAVYAIGIAGRGFSPDALEHITEATGGAYFAAATTTALTQIYASIAEELKRTWRVSYLTAARPGETVRLEARLAGHRRALLDVRLAGTAPGPAQPGKISKLIPEFLYQHNIGTMALALFVGGCMILVVGLVVGTPREERLRRRIEPHVGAPKRERGRKRTPRERFPAAAAGVLASTERVLGQLSFWGRLHRLLERADVPLRTVEFFYISMGSAFVLGLIAAAAAAPSLVILVVLVTGGALPVIFLWFRARRRLAAIDEQLPDLLITVAASLKAGHSFRQGLQAVVEEGQPPASDEFKRVLTDTSLGRPMDDALDDMSERLGSKNLSFVVTAVTIQRQVGGSLAGIFDMVADAVRQRQQFARKIKSLTAMGRLSAYVLIAMPFLLAGAFTTLNAEYMAPMWTTSAGHKLIILGFVMMAFGSLVLKKIVSFKG